MGSKRCQHLVSTRAGLHLPDELLGNIDICSEIAWWVERKCRHDVSTVTVVAVGAGSTQGEESPSRRIPSVGDAGRRGFEEVELIDGAAVHRAGQYGEELQ